MKPSATNSGVMIPSFFSLSLASLVAVASLFGAEPLGLIIFVSANVGQRH